MNLYEVYETVEIKWPNRTKKYTDLVFTTTSPDAIGSFMLGRSIKTHFIRVTPVVRFEEFEHDDEKTDVMQMIEYLKEKYENS